MSGKHIDMRKLVMKNIERLRWLWFTNTLSCINIWLKHNWTEITEIHDNRIQIFSWSFWNREILYWNCTTGIPKAWLGCLRLLFYFMIMTTVINNEDWTKERFLNGVFPGFFLAWSLSLLLLQQQLANLTKSPARVPPVPRKHEIPNIITPPPSERGSHQAFVAQDSIVDI